MYKFGTVLSTSDNQVKVAIKRSSTCGDKCGSCSGKCDQLEKIVALENTQNFQPGQNVSVEIDDSKVLKAAFLVYIFPLIMLIIGVFIGSTIYSMLQLSMNSELFNLMIGILMMALAFTFVKYVDNKKSKENYTGWIKEKI